jgi:hypothetical protein
MRNRFLDERTARDIDILVAKILRGLGRPEPPLVLDDVRALQKLDRHYYSSVDEGPLREFVSRAYIGAKQVFSRPTLILDVVRKRSLKALYLPDRKRVLIDSSQPKLKWRWSETHEIIHDGVPWHQDAMFGDTEYTLSPDCHEQIEAEANYGAGRLLFFQDQFREFASGSEPTFELIKAATKRYGNTMTSTLWRLVEALDIPALGIVGSHPRGSADPDRPAQQCRYFIRSRAFMERFGNMTEDAACAVLRAHASFKRGGPIANVDVTLVDDRGESQLFHLESFYNGHEALTIFTHKGPSLMKMTVSSVAVPMNISSWLRHRR